MNSNTLVCTDFSTLSDVALKAAYDLCNRTKSELHVLHVVELPVQWDWSGETPMSEYFNEKFELDLLNSSRRRVDEQIVKTGIQGKAIVTLGIPHSTIHWFISEKNINLLFMGHKGKGAGPFQLGGLSTKMIASAAVPVLIVKNELRMNKVAGLVDPSGPMKNIIESAEEMATILSCPLEVVSLIADWPSRFIGIGKVGFSTELLSMTEEEKQEATKQIKEKIREKLSPSSKAEIKVEITHERKFAYHLNTILSRDHSNIAVMKRHQAAFIEKILIGSESRRLVEIFDGNLLILPPGNE